MVNQMMVVIIAMGLVTCTPRILSMVAFKDFRPNHFFKRFFDLIPYAMLSVLIFPDVFSACGNLKLSLVGVATAILLALMKRSATVVVLGAVLSVYLFQIT